MSMCRFECYLYGKLIAILIGSHTQTLLAQVMKAEQDFELSPWKAYKLIKKAQ
jgi:hypothetical protein